MPPGLLNVTECLMVSCRAKSFPKAAYDGSSSLITAESAEMNRWAVASTVLPDSVMAMAIRGKAAPLPLATPRWRTTSMIRRSGCCLAALPALGGAPLT